MNPLSKLLFNSDNQLIVRLDIVFDIKMLSFPGLKGCVTVKLCNFSVIIFTFTFSVYIF